MPASSEMLDIAIIGAADPHVEYVLSEIAVRTDVRVVAVADHDPARRTELERRTKTPGYADPNALLDAHRVRAAAVFTEFGLRAPIVVELLRRGIFAIADKPMAVTLAQLALIEETLAGRNLLTLLLEKRFYPVTLALRSVIDSGQLGDIVSITATGPHKLVPSRRPAWMFEPSTYGGILADLTVHDIDLALWLTGYTSGTISGWISSTPAAGTTNFPALGRAILACDGGPESRSKLTGSSPKHRHGTATTPCGSPGQRVVLTFCSRKIDCSSRRRRDPGAKSTCPWAPRPPASSLIISPAARPCRLRPTRPCAPRVSQYLLRRARPTAENPCDGVNQWRAAARSVR
ncbi:Gfo/Idh/MocA family protein [Bradyrhizobium sp. 1050_B9_N1_2]|uniref:Gfo/Idh/MocA family protein n=1 Tax=Bradyrhizobium sp. 1050_B9_N1_2 TaxID=3238688 RepID=UPI003EDC5A89